MKRRYKLWIYTSFTGFFLLHWIEKQRRHGRLSEQMVSSGPKIMTGEPIVCPNEETDKLRNSKIDKQ